LTTIHYYDSEGKNGFPVLLLHGLGVDGSSWVLQTQPLVSAGFRPIALDVPGFGSSPCGKEKWSIKRVARDIDPVHVVGLSMGGTIGQQLTLDYPHMVSKLVLANTFSVLRPGTLPGWGYFFQRFLLVHTLGLPVQAEYVAKRIFPAPEQELLRRETINQIIKADPRAYRAAMRSLGLFNSKRRLNEIKIPTLVITGAKDTTVNPDHQKEMTGWIPGARQVIINSSGHAASVECPDEFNRILVEFLLEKTNVVT
jgi:3-oxoadipate enol-lactonase